MEVGKNKQGFTIVELLIVVVVIAILAAITIVSYNGITNNAKESAVQSDVRNFGMKIAEDYAKTGVYPVGSGGGNAPAGMSNFVTNKNAYSSTVNNFYYCVADDNSQFAVAGQSSTGKKWAFYSNGGVKEYTGAWTNSGNICLGTLGTSAFSFSYGQTSAGSWFAWTR